MAGIPRNVRLIFVLFFSRLFVQPIAGHIQERKYRNIFATEINNFLCFIFVVLLSHSGWSNDARDGR